MAKYREGRDPRVTNESCWKAVDDLRLPNPPQDTEHAADKHYAGLVANRINETKIIMAHEFRENPEGYKDMAQNVVNVYNEANQLPVGEEIPEGSSLCTEEYKAREAGIPTGFKEEK